jgi:lipid-A-disaccharide synthase
MGASPSPDLLVLRESARALGQGLALPLRAAAYLGQRERLRRELRADLAAPRAPDEPPPLPELRGRRPVVFVSAAEASGEIHARNLVRALRAACAEAGAEEPRLLGLGGARLAAEGVELVGRPVERAQMGLSGLSANLGYWLGLAKDCARAFGRERPDVFVPVDSPALHVPLARIAHSHGIPAVHFVAPQYWGWAPWRAASYARAVDLALTILPFELSWFERAGVRVAHVGHPLQDALADVPVSRPATGARALVLLPGSRAHVIEQNLPWMLGVLADVRAQLRGAELVVAHEDEELEPLLERVVARSAVPGVRLALGDLQRTLASARAAFSVSGTVLLDLLHHRLPAVVLYRLGSAREAWLGRHFLSVPWFSSVNLLADAEAYPEFSFHGRGPRAEVGAALLRCYNDEPWRELCATRLELAAGRLGGPGACARAARHVLARLAPPTPLGSPRRK